MMESIALTEYDDYVMVLTDDMDVDENSYDNCDKELVQLPPIPSSAESTCSDESSSEGYVPHDIEDLIEDSLISSIVSLESSDSRGGMNDSDVPKLFVEDGEITEEISRDSGSETDNAARVTYAKSSTNFHLDILLRTEEKPSVGGGSRLSNKKRRKRVKKLKKAAASTVALAALTEQQTSSVNPSLENRLDKQTRPKTPKTKQKQKPSLIENMQVACATESLQLYRKEHNLKIQKSPPNFVSLL